MSEQQYEILRAVWFSPQAPVMQVGVVAIKSGRDRDKWKAYIGLAGGINENADEQFVAGYGAKIVDKAQAQAFFPDLDIEDFIT